MAISPTLAINMLTKERINQGLKTYKLGFGQSPFPVPDILREELQKHAGIKDYLPSQGLAELRSQICEYYGSRFNIKSSSDNIIVGPGSKELLFLTQLILKRELILPEPSWVSYAPQAELLNSKAHYIQTHIENNWNLTANELENFIKSQDPSKKFLIILNYPNNPTGQIMEPEELRSIADLARKYDIVIISDEIYAEFCFNNDHISIAEYYPEKTIICSGLSKWCGAGGWRLGYMIFPDELRSELNSLISAASECYSCASAPIQFASIKAFENGDAIKSYTETCKQILIKAHEILIKYIDRDCIDFLPAKGGFYIFLKFKKDIFPFHTSTELCEALLNQTGVALLPGSSFGLDPSTLSARLAFVDLPEIDFNKILHSNNRSYLESEYYFNSLKMAIFSMNEWLKLILQNK